MSSRTAIQMVLAASLGLAAGAMMDEPRGGGGGYTLRGQSKSDTKKRVSKAKKKAKRKMAKASKRKNRG